jgi:hypothetical protein
VVTRPAQLVRYRLDRHHGFGLGFLSLVETRRRESAAAPVYLAEIAFSPGRSFGDLVEP